MGTRYSRLSDEGKAKFKQAVKEYRLRKIENGMCVYCVKPAIDGLKRCLECQVKTKTHHSTPEYKAKKNANRRKRLREDPQYAMVNRLRKRVGRAIRDYAPGMKLRQTKQYIGCTMDEFMAHIESQFVEGMTWDNRELWHIDHVRPCSSFDLTNLEEQQKCFNYTNLQPLWAIDNILKNDIYENISLTIIS